MQEGKERKGFINWLMNKNEYEIEIDFSKGLAAHIEAKRDAAVLGFFGDTKKRQKELYRQFDEEKENSQS